MLMKMDVAAFKCVYFTLPTMLCIGFIMFLTSYFGYSHYGVVLGDVSGEILLFLLFLIVA